ncbi:hypothetical protein IMSAGC011_02879 [Lachnospiraceae bacterium]|nr:hypothetical protein IMSAGC011_02879 [Lachnospiraceae bacterium]
MSKKKNRPHGHYCKICGEYKANEKFSGKGHAAHICKACSRLSAAEKADAMAINRMMGFPMRRLSDGEKKWLQAKMYDKSPEVADTAREIYNICFPYAERNAMKKQLIINTLSFEVHTEVYDGYGDMELADRRFTIDRKSRVLTMTDFCTDSGEQSVTLEGREMSKLLRYIVHTLEIFMWEQDYCLNPDEDDFFTDILLGEGIYEDDLEEKEEALPAEPEGRPSWQVHIEYSSHTVQDISSYVECLPERPEELYLTFMEYFELDEDDFESGFRF